MKILFVYSPSRHNSSDGIPLSVQGEGAALVALGCEVDFFPVLTMGIKGYKKNISPLREKIASFQPDIVHAHTGNCGRIAVKALRRHRFLPHLGSSKLIITFHSGETHERKARFVNSWYSCCADHVVYVSAQIRDRVTFKPAKANTSVLPVGITLSDYHTTPYAEAREKLGWKSPLEKRYILFGGAFTNKRKNYGFLQKAEMLLHRSGKLGRDIEVVELRGLSREECALRMSACDVFCLPSFMESSAQTLKEAMVIGCPCVATDVADIKMLMGIMDGHYIIRNHSRHSKAFWRGGRGSTQELATKLVRAVQFSDERLAADPLSPRTEGRERIKALGMSNEFVASELMKIYKKILS